VIGSFIGYAPILVVVLGVVWVVGFSEVWGVMCVSIHDVGRWLVASNLSYYSLRLSSGEFKCVSTKTGERAVRITDIEFADINIVEDLNQRFLLFVDLHGEINGVVKPVANMLGVLIEKFVSAHQRQGVAKSVPRWFLTFAVTSRRCRLILSVIRTSRAIPTANIMDGWMDGFSVSDEAAPSG
jgi:hypothetical protein